MTFSGPSTCQAMRNFGNTVELWDVWISSAGLRFLGEEMAPELIQMCKISWGNVTFLCKSRV